MVESESAQHQVMGYDRAITMFSPDGRLLQVEYAKKTVRQGSTAMAFVCKNGVLLVADKRIVDPLIIPEAIEKIWKIDEHIGVTAAGIVSDARVLIERAQLTAQQHTITYDTPIDILSIVKDVCSLKQICTQSAGLRPFGISLLIAGVDEDGPKVYETDPTGIYFRYKAAVIGEYETEIERELHKEYKDSLTIDAALELAIKLLLKATNKKITPARITAAFIETGKKKYTEVEPARIKKLVEKLK